MKRTSRILLLGALPVASAMYPLSGYAAPPTGPSPSVSGATSPEAGDYIDYSKLFPWFPPLKSALGPEELAVMAKLRAMPRYNPKPLRPVRSGTTPAMLEALENRVTDVLDLKEDATTGRVTGRALVYTGDRGPTEPDKTKPANFITDFYPLFDEAFRAYENSRGAEAPVTARSKALLVRLLTHFANQPLDGVRSGGKFMDPGFGYVWVKEGGKGLRMLSASALLTAPATRANLLENLIWMQGGIGAKSTSTLSTDEYLNTTPQYLAAISLMRDCPAKWQRLIMARHAMDTSILARHRLGTVSPDGGVIHHSYAHDAYASYEFGPLCRLLRDLNDCGVPPVGDADEIARRIARAGVAWAWTHQPAFVVTNIQGRPSLPFLSQRDAATRPGAGDFAIEAALTLMSFKRPVTYREDATRLLALALAKNPATVVPKELEPLREVATRIHDTLTGSLAYPVAGAILQRRDNWLVSVRASPPGRTGGEGMPYGAWGTRITFGGLFCKGSLMLIADGAKPGAPADLIFSGYAVEGRDMSLMPGVTAPILPWEKMIGRWHSSGAAFSAPVALDGQGVSGFATDTVAKSCFLFDNRITYATVLRDEAKPAARTRKTPAKKTDEAPLATTFIQFRHADGAADPESFDGKPFSKPATLHIADDKPHTFLATGGHGYYLWPTTETLELFRREQENRICETPDGKAPYAPQNRALSAPKPENALPYKGDFTTGYWLHDPKERKNTPVVFTLLVKSGGPGLEDFAKRMQNTDAAPERLTVSPTAHILYDSGSGMYGAVFFAAGERGPGHERNAGCPVLAADRPCSALLKKSGPMLTLAVSGGEEIEKTAPISLTLKGGWKLADGPVPPGTTVEKSPSGDDTRLTVGASAPAGNPVRLVIR